MANTNGSPTTIKRECRTCYFFKKSNELMGFCLKFDQQVCIAHEDCPGYVQR